MALVRAMAAKTKPDFASTLVSVNHSTSSGTTGRTNTAAELTRNITVMSSSIVGTRMTVRRFST